MAVWKLAPALAAGNAVVLKPAEQTPASIMYLMSLIADLLPPGIVNVVNGFGVEAGKPLASSNRIAKIAFTGETTTGRLIMQYASQNLIPVTLELGGKSPLIVLEDADLQAAAATGALMYRNAGQVCLAGTRFLVHDQVVEPFVQALRAQVDKLRVGDPREEGTEVGPIIHPRQLDRVEGFVQRAVADGARLLWGGARHAFGAQYFEPTMLTDVQQDSEIERVRRGGRRVPCHRRCEK
jgi:5-carboxymethyl-2-hydroxymuconic-semialdehyde dehydrogenase